MKKEHIIYLDKHSTYYYHLPLFIVDAGQISMHHRIVGTQVKSPEVRRYRSENQKTHHVNILEKRQSSFERWMGIVTKNIESKKHNGYLCRDAKYNTSKALLKFKKEKK